MSGLSSVMNSALKSMVANQAALSVASNNIANAQTPEFSRQRLVLTPSGGGGDRFMIGTGVDVAGVEAVRDQLIETRLRQETSAKAGDETLARGLSNVELLFNDADDSGLLLKITNFFNSFHTLSLDPASINFREEVKIAGQALVDSFQSRHRELTNIANVADRNISSDVGRINTLSSQIASVTAQIKLQETGHPANDLRDRRAALVKQLSEIVGLNELESEGEYQLTTKSNHLLVLNGTAQTLSTTDITAAIGSGSLKAQLDIRDQYIPAYITALDQLAYEVTQQVNTIHTAGYSLDGSTSINFFTALGSATGAAQLMSLNSVVAADVRKIAASKLPAGNDNSVAVQLGNLLHAPVFTSGSVTDQYRMLVFTVATDVSNAETNLKEHTALVNQLENRRQSVSGVSIDEETTNILQFQRSYEASARLVRTVDELLQVLLGMGA